MADVGAYCAHIQLSSTHWGKTMPEKIAFICVNISQREGSFFASSSDLPGLYLCGKALKYVSDDIGPMIERLYLLNHKIKVRAAKAVDPVSFDAPAANEDHIRYFAASESRVA